MLRIRAAALRLIVPAVAACFAVHCGDEAKSWRITWRDEFDGPAGQPPDLARWRHDIGEDWGNAQLEFDTDRTANAALDGNGNLVITAREESYRGRAYTSARINTSERFAQAYGRFEARIRLPVGPGIWPAFWLLGADFAETGWPACGEIDIMEFRGQEPSITHASIHGPGYSGAQAVTGRYEFPHGGLHEDFHVWGAEWDESRIQWFLDGVPMRTVTRDSLPGGGRWVFDHPFFLILNLAVGGHFVGPPDSTTVFPQSMLVDWVRVWERR